MSATELPATVSGRPRLPPRLVVGLAGAGLIAGTAFAQAGAPDAVAVLVAAAGAACGLRLLAPLAARAVMRSRGLVSVLLLIAGVGVWIEAGVRRTEDLQGRFVPRGFMGGTPTNGFVRAQISGTAGWPWRLGDTSLLSLALVILGAISGVVLLSDAVRLRLGLAPLRSVPWRVLTAPRERRGRILAYALPGVVLIIAATTLGIALANHYVVGNAALEALVLLVAGAAAAMLIGSPLLVGWWLRLDRDKVGTAREEERQRFAAHLHDSVLQTLALVQRQAHDPAAVMRLARRQEHALRAWMAGESELVSDTLAAALRDVVAEVEDEYAMTIELTAIGDRALDPAGEALVAAAREALRNAGRHAPGASVVAFGEITATRVELFVRDQGPGFEPASVAAERRGIRDAMVGRMAMVGGRAVIESVPGEGTEVALTVGS
jgi:signal transduction histidine kinase